MYVTFNYQITKRLAAADHRSLKVWWWNAEEEFHVLLRGTISGTLTFNLLHRGHQRHIFT